MHPKDKAERRQIESSAKVLHSKIFHGRKINAKKRKLKVQIEEKEADDELRGVSRGVAFSGTAVRADQAEAVLDGVRTKTE